MPGSHRSLMHHHSLLATGRGHGPACEPSSCTGHRAPCTVHSAWRVRARRKKHSDSPDGLIARALPPGLCRCNAGASSTNPALWQASADSPLVAFVLLRTMPAASFRGGLSRRAGKNAMPFGSQDVEIGVGAALSGRGFRAPLCPACPALWLNELGVAPGVLSSDGRRATDRVRGSAARASAERPALGGLRGLPDRAANRPGVVGKVGRSSRIRVPACGERVPPPTPVHRRRRLTHNRPDERLRM